MTDRKSINKTVREALCRAVQLEVQRGEFKLSGRGHEDRVTLDVQLASVLRGTELPRVYISGFGANYYYPKRIFTTAQRVIGQKPGSPALRILESTATVYLVYPGE